MPTMSTHPPPQSNPTISKGTEILLFASIIPALAIIFYITSRIIRNATKVKKPNDLTSASLVEKILSSSTPPIDTKPPELSHHSKKESRIQDLRRYFSPSQQAPSSPSFSPFKPFANHRCSISLKPSTPTSTSSRLRPLSLLSVIRKDTSKFKPASRCPPHAPTNPYSGPSSAHLNPISELERLAMTRLSALADSVVGAHPDAEPLHTRSVKSHMIRSKDFRLVSASGSEIPWYTPADKGIAIVVPNIARGDSVKALVSTSIRTFKYEKDRQRYPNSSSNKKITSSRIPVSRSSPILDPVSDVSFDNANVVSASTPARPLSVTSSSSNPSEPSPPRPSSLSGSILNASSVQANLESRSPSLGDPARHDFSRHPVEIVPSVVPSPRKRTKAAWDERVPGLVTMTQNKAVSQQPSGEILAKGRSIKADRGGGHELKSITNLGKNPSQPESLVCRMIGKKIPRSGHGRVVSPSRDSLNARTKRLRDVKGRKLPQDGKENWPVGDGMVGSAF